MRLATLRDGTRDGALIVVGPDGDRFLRPDDVAPTLQAALDEWTARRRSSRSWRAAGCRPRQEARRAAGPWRSSGRRCRALRMDRRLGVPDPRAARARRARRHAARDTRDRSARLPGRLGRPARAARRHPAARSRLGPGLRERGRRHPGRHAAGDARRPTRTRTCGC
jgi:hypothetical protein